MAERVRNFAKVVAALLVLALEQARVPCGPIYNLDEALNDPQVNARKIIGKMSFSGSRRPVPIANTPFHLSTSPSGLRRSAPTLGEHTAEVLSGLGFSPEEIESFRKMKVI